MVDNPKPKFAPYQTWGACSRCGDRVAYDTLKRERLTGLLMCSETSGRPVKPCWDPWPEVFDFQVAPDKSIEPPPEPLPLRWNLDDVWGSGNNPKPAPDDATRLQALVRNVPSYKQMGVTAQFAAPNPIGPQSVHNVTTIDAAAYDGTFLPSGSVRTVTPPDAAQELADTSSTDIDLPNDKLWAPPWAAAEGI